MDFYQTTTAISIGINILLMLHFYLNSPGQRNETIKQLRADLDTLKDLLTRSEKSRFEMESKFTAKFEKQEQEILELKSKTDLSIVLEKLDILISK